MSATADDGPAAGVPAREMAPTEMRLAEMRLAEMPRCSAKGCRADATTDLTWRNPRLHDAARVKHWLACPGHADQLAEFLSRRGFLLERGPLQPDHG